VRGANLRWALLLAAAAAITLPAAWSASRLQVVTRLEDLLPEDAPAAADYRTFLATFGGFEKVYAMVLWRGEGEADQALLAEAADLLAEGLAAAPEVAAVRSGLAPADEEFFRRRVLPAAPLFLGRDEDLAARIDPAAVRRRVGEIRDRLRSPGGAVEAPWLAADPLGFTGGLAGLAGGGALSLVDPMTGAFLSAGGDAALVVVTPAAGELDPAAGRALEAALERAFAAAVAELGAGYAGELGVGDVGEVGTGDAGEPRAGDAQGPDAGAESGTAAGAVAPSLALAAVGGPLYAAADERIVRQDLGRTLAGSALLIAILLVAYFGRLAVPLALVLAVAVGIVWTAGAVAAIDDEVSVLGLSFAAMLLGLGIDYGIHGATRFRDRRLGGLPRPAAMRAGLAESGPAILASMATTAVAFLVLSLAHFRPVEELGQVMAVGIVLILLASLSVAAPLLVLVRPVREWRRTAAPVPPATPPGLVWRGLGGAVAVAVALGRRRRRAVAVAAVALSALAAAGASRLELSIDLRSLRPTDHPAFAAERLLVEGFGLGLDASTVVVRGDDLGAALDRARRVERAVAAVAGDQVAIVSPAAWLPAGEVVERRLARLAGGDGAAALAALEDEIARQGLARAPFEPALAVLAAAARGERPAALDPEAWPDWVRELVRVGEGGAAVAVRLTTPLGTWPNGPPPEVVAAVEAAAPGSAVASVPRVGGELRRLILGDFGRLGGWALLAVAAVVTLSFAGRPRPLRGAALALVPVVLGSLWTLGFAGFAGVPIDPFTIVVAPLLLGIGIDDGLHALQGERAFGDLPGSLAASGRAMTLTTLTTCVGFGSLAFSRVPSLARGGLLVAVGTFLCLVVTLVVLPALDAALSGRRRPRPARRAG
jgi:predicted RND superfamily exporter protein